MKRLLLATAATALFATPSFAQAVDATVTFENEIATDINTDVSFEADVAIMGDIEVEGDIDIDSAAIAVGDSQQITTDLQVIFDEPSEEDPESEAVNTSNAGDVDSDGNVGVNSAAGYYNSQANVATISVSTGGDDDDTDGPDGSAQASTTGYQVLTGTYYGPEYDDAGNDPYEDTNTATTGAIMGNGNVGVNTAAGAFNQQQNMMTLAVADDSALSQATAGVIQHNMGNNVILNDSVNTTELGGVMGAGNVQVNAAAGVGNQQHNSLTISATVATAEGFLGSL